MLMQLRAFLIVIAALSTLELAALPLPSVRELLRLRFDAATTEQLAPALRNDVPRTLAILHSLREEETHDPVTTRLPQEKAAKLVGHRASMPFEVGTGLVLDRNSLLGCVYSPYSIALLAQSHPNFETLPLQSILEVVRLVSDHANSHLAESTQGRLVSLFSAKGADRLSNAK